MPGEEHGAGAAAANYGAQDAIGAGAGADGLSDPLRNFIKWSATQNLGGERTAKVQEIIAKAKPIIERKAKDIYQEPLPGLLKDREDGFDHKAVIDALDLDKKIDSPENIEAVKNAINIQRKGGEYDDAKTQKLLNSLKGATTQKFNEFFEELAQEYYKNSLVDPLSKVNQFVDAFAAAIGGPQSLLGHALGAWYRNAKANTLGDIAKKLVDDLESRYKDNGSEVDGAGRLKFSAGQKRGPDDGGGAGAGAGVGLAPPPPPPPPAKRVDYGDSLEGGATLSASDGAISGSGNSGFVGAGRYADAANHAAAASAAAETGVSRDASSRV